VFKVQAGAGLVADSQPAAEYEGNPQQGPWPDSRRWACLRSWKPHEWPFAC